MATIQHVFNSTDRPTFSAEPGAHCVDADGNHYLCSGGNEWIKLIPESLATLYMTTFSTPPEPPPSQGAICTATYSEGDIFKVWVTVNMGGETWAWHEIQQAAAPV